MYEHRYKRGKQKTIMPNATFEAAMQDAVNQGEDLETLAYVTLLWHTGARKSEVYERPLSDVTVSKKFVVVDFHARKKHGEEVPPLKIPLSFYGVTEYLMPWIESRQKSKPPHKSSWKGLKHQVETEETRVTPNGKNVTVKKTVLEKKRGVWLFPHVASTSAWRVVKRILGDKYYPHYMRLRKLTRAGEGGKNWFDAQDRIRSISGLKSVAAREAYLGTKADGEQVMSESE